MSVTFVDADRHKEVTTWEMEDPYSGGVMLNNHTLLLYGKQVKTADLYSLQLVD